MVWERQVVFMAHLHLIKQQKILNTAHFLYTVLFEAL